MEKLYDGSPMIEVNGRRYALPRAPVVVVCVDGCEPDYLDRAVEGGAMPWLGSARAGGTSLVGDCVMPSFTNPNNLDRHRRATVGARHLGQLLLGSAGGRRGHDERPEISARRDHPG